MVKFARCYMLIALMGGFVVCQRSGAQITSTANGYDFRVKYTTGMQLRYLMHSTITGTQMPQGGPTEITMPMSMHVLDVRSGIATIQASIGPAKMGATAMGDAQKITMKVDSHGRPQGDNPALKSIGNVLANLPVHPVRVGESFSAPATTVPVPGGNMDLSYKITLRGFKVVHGRRCAMLDSTVSAKSANMSVDGTGTSLIASDDGSMVDTSMTMTMQITGASGPMTFAQKISITRE